VLQQVALLLCQELRVCQLVAQLANGGGRLVLDARGGVLL